MKKVWLAVATIVVARASIIDAGVGLFEDGSAQGVLVTWLGPILFPIEAELGGFIVKCLWFLAHIGLLPM